MSAPFRITFRPVVEALEVRALPAAFFGDGVVLGQAGDSVTD